MTKRLRPSDMPLLPELTLVLPARNEAPLLGAMLIELAGLPFARALGPRLEVIVVDDGSTDGTAEEARRSEGALHNLRILRSKHNVGKGESIKRGFNAAAGRRVAAIDGDNTFSLQHLEEFSAEIDRGADVVIGNRRLPETIFLVRPDTIPYIHLRDSIGRRFNDLVRLLTALPFTDTQCGFKMFTAEAARACVSQILVGGFVFDLELLLTAVAGGLRIVERPVTLRYRDTDPLHKVARMSWEVWFDLLRVTYHQRAGRYGGGAG